MIFLMNSLRKVLFNLAECEMQSTYSSWPSCLSSPLKKGQLILRLVVEIPIVKGPVDGPHSVADQKELCSSQYSMIFLSKTKGSYTGRKAEREMSDK